ncbi:MAG: adenylosuccinate lyase, partial [Victivallales bacterium]|nr:adenylosuccinate lyase [Victivallales bacterium]
MADYGVFESPFSTRYASPEMQHIFSAENKFRTWRRLWIVLAEAEKELGLDVTQEQIDEMKSHQDDINYQVAEEQEKKVRHDVMSHVYAYGVQCPNAKPIIHLGATSCYVGDNTDIIVMRQAMELLRGKVLSVLAKLAVFAEKNADLPTLAFTHFQPAQPTTVGKRACLWMNDLLLDLEDIDHFLATLRLLGSKGTTGTQASFLELFNGDHAKCRKLDEKIAEKTGFPGCYPVSGQTYSRKVDSRALNVLSGIAQSAAKFSNDIRLLQHMKEVEEPFEKSQIGSSAMAYKRNPMRSERIGSLARFVIASSINPAVTAATQWLERTLDDSANRRLAVAESFLAVDSILDIFANVSSGLVVYPKVIEKHLLQELPFMATENIMMDAVKAGGDRQELHERIRELSMEAGRRVKEDGADNNLLEL